MQWRGFFIGMAAIGVAVYMNSEEEVKGGVVEFKEAETGTVYPRMAEDKGGRENPTRVWTRAELAERDGKNANRELMLSVAGEVYDVGSGEKHYSPGHGYSGFTGRDASRAYVTGEYNETSVSGLSDLKDTQVKAVLEWRGFYRDHESYRFVGVLEGEYFTRDGKPTEHLLEVNERFERAIHDDKLQRDLSAEFKSCNSRHEGAKDHFELWCDDSYHVKSSYPVFMITRVKKSPDATPPGRCVCATDEMVDTLVAKNTEPKTETVSRFLPFPECEKGVQHCFRPKGAKPPE